MVIDNEMLTSIRRILRGIEVNDETLSVEVIKQSVAGPGHFLGSGQTINLMNTEYVYPKLSDRSSPDDWLDAGARDIWQCARERAREVLTNHYPTRIDAHTDRAIRRDFPIRLEPLWLVGQRI